MSKLFTPLSLRSLELPNRVFVSPMCQYSSEDGMPNDWHFVHLGSRAIGGAALVITEASAVSPEGRITPWDAGIWSPAHAQAWKPVVNFMRMHGAVPGMQIAHAGRKASCNKPWLGGKALPVAEGGWVTSGPSAIPFGDYPAPRAMTEAEMDATVAAFVASTRHALAAGFEVVELHAAHGYLLHEFLSPHSNHRTDAYGGSLENRMRFPLRVATAMRDALPDEMPLLVRISATDWKDGGWDLEQSIAFCKALKALGADFVTCSSGGNVADQRIDLGPGYQVPSSDAVRREAGIPTGAVGLITEATQAEHILHTGQADAVVIARAMLRDPYWPRHAAKALGDTVAWPDPYRRCDVGPLGR